MNLLPLARRLGLAAGWGFAAAVAALVLGVVISIVEFTDTSRTGQTAPPPTGTIFFLLDAGITLAAASLVAWLVGLLIAVLRTSRRR